MTLLFRLFWTVLAGAILAIATYKLLWPAPQYVGTYLASNKTGVYRLNIVDDTTATVLFKDRKGKRHAYMGEVEQSGNQITIQWKSQRVGNEWQRMPQVILETLTVDRDGKLTGRYQQYRHATSDDKDF